MRIAVCGKGGSGKSTIAGALARHLAMAGESVVALDADPNPNLGVPLGVSPEVVESMTPILNALIDAGYTHDKPKPPAEELLQRYGVDAPEGIRLVATGKIERPSDSCLCCGSHNTTRQFFADLPDLDRTVVADLEAGLNDLIWASPGSDDVVLVITEGSAKSTQIARRAVDVARQLGVKRIIGVANRSVGTTDLDAIRAALDVDEILTVPEDPAIEAADQQGRAPMDTAPTSPAMAAIASIAELVRA